MDPSGVIPGQSDDRSSQALRLADECLRRRISGETLPDDEVIADHPDLMPELGEALHKLALIQRAVRRSRGGTRPTQTVGDTSSGTFQLPPDSFPGYEIVDELRRGGQAVVYRGVQIATRRSVAIKVMKEGPFAGPANKARFDREVHILGQLNHANIVTIHDSGEAAGHFYYTMDYISGQPLDEYANGGRRDIKETLRLFAKICEAVNAAHLRGVIHRDLKPSNIRVDASGEPYVLDFGLAKLAGESSSSAAMTMTGQFIGSAPWASPEQAEGSPSRIDLRTDVYSLGVILYQVLTGKFPYEILGTMREILDQILTAEPARPSAIRRQIDDEVETIVLKCLAKECDRRYQTAGELARDIRHYLADEPIEAKRDSLAYVMGKHLRKYKIPAMIIAAFVAVVTVGFVTSVTFWGQAVVERDRAEAARQASEQARAAEESQRRNAETSARRAEHEAAKAEAVNQFLQEMLASVDPAGLAGREVTVREVLDEAVQRIAHGSLTDQPEVEAAVRITLGSMYTELGLYNDAEPHLHAALEIRREISGDEHVEVADCLSALGMLFTNTGDYKEAERLHYEALAMRKKLLGDEHEAVAASLTNLGIVLLTRGDFTASEPLLREGLEMNRRLLGDDDLQVALGQISVANLLNSRGDYADAEPLYRESLEMCRRLLGDRHVYVADCLNSLGVLLLEKHDYGGAEPLLREALAVRREAVGDEHPAVASSLANLAAALHRQGKLAEAEPLLRQALEIKRATLGERHPAVGVALATLGIVLCEKGDYAEAEPLQREALEIDREILGDQHPTTAISLFNLAAPLGMRGDWAGAEPLLREALTIQRTALPAGHSHTSRTLEGLGTALLEQEKFAEAEPVFRECLAAFREVLPERHWLIARVKSRLGASLAGLGRFVEAEPLLLAGYVSMPKELEPIQRIIGLYEAWDKPEKLAEWRDKLPTTQPAEDDR